MPINLLENEAPIDLLANTQPPQKTILTGEAGMPTGREPDNSAAQWLGVANRALAPYATAAGAGALAGAPFGGVGAIPGAVMGVTALGLGDLGTSLYNIGTGAFGGRRVPLPSETIQNVYESIGIGREPQTPEQRIAANTLSAMAGAGSQAQALNTLSRYARSPTTQNVFRELGAQPATQAVVGGASAAVPSILQEQGVTDPFTLAMSSVAGGAIGAKGAGIVGRRAQTAENTGKFLRDKVLGNKTATTDDLRLAADDAYDEARAAGVAYDPKSYSDFIDSLEANFTSQGYSAKFDPIVKEVIGRLDEYRNVGQTPSLTDVMRVRQAIARSKINPDANVRRLAGDVVDRIDDFLERPPTGAVVSGDPAGMAALEQGRKLYAKMRKSETIEDILANADLNKPNAANIIRSEFTQLAKNKKRMLRFNEEEQAAIRSIAAGDTTPKTLSIISRIAPGTTTKGVLIGMGLGAGAYSQGADLGEAAVLGSIGLGARGGLNYLAKRNVRNLASGIRRGDAQAPFVVPPNAMISPISQQFLNQLAIQAGQ